MRLCRIFRRSSTADRTADHAVAEIDADTLRMYYTAQYERVAQHETHRLALSNYVIAGSVTALAFLASPWMARSDHPEPAAMVQVTLSVSLALINGLAIRYAFRARYWTRIHLGRVDAALKQLSPRLSELQATADKEAGREESEPPSAVAHRIQSWIHALIVVVALVMGITPWISSHDDPYRDYRDPSHWYGNLSDDRSSCRADPVATAARRGK